MLKGFLVTSFFLLSTYPLKIHAGFNKDRWLNSGKSCVKYHETRRGKQSCAYEQQLKLMTLQGAIGMCGHQNGILEADDVWPFAIENLRYEYMKKKMTINERLLKVSLYDHFYKTNEISKRFISKYGGCNKLLKDEYPSFVRKEAPSKEDIRETMQDTPFQW